MKVGAVKVYSDIPYPWIKKSKLQQIYEGTKDKIKDTYNFIKEKFSSKNKENEQDNELYERE